MRVGAVAVISDLGSRIVARCLEANVNVPACDQIAVLTRKLLGVLENVRQLEEVNALGEGALRVLKRLEHQMRVLRNLITRACLVPRMYRVINAYQISTDFKHACQYVGATLHELNSLLTPPARDMGFDVRSLAIDFSRANFPLRNREKGIFDESQLIADRIYGNEISMKEGVEMLQKILEKTLGKDNIEADWKQVAKQLFYDMDFANLHKDATREHHIRLLFWALSGPESPPPEFYCPINMEIMDDPVVLTESAVTYDRKSLEVWLSPHGPQKCPVTKKKLTTCGYVENKSLRILIEDWKRANGYIQKPIRQEADLYKIASEDRLISEDCVDSDDGIGQQTIPLPNPISHPIIPSEILDPAPGPMSSGRQSIITSPKNECPVYPQEIIQMRRLDVRQSDETPSGSSVLRSGNTYQRSSRRAVREMLMAAEQGDLECVASLAEEGWRLDDSNDEGMTALHCASAGGHLSIVEFLLARGVNINARLHSTAMTPLYLAACSGHGAVVDVLLRHNANIMITNKNGWSPLHAAADTGHRIVVRLLLDFAERERHIMYPTLATEAGWTALHYAVRCGDLEIIKTLLPFFPHVNHKCNIGFTPLHVAVDNGRADVVDILLKANPDPNAQSNDGWTALHAAQDNDHIDIGRMLLKSGADPDIAGQDGITPLHRAAFQNHIQFTQLLVEEGAADLHRKTMPKGETGRKAIDIASDMNHSELYSYLFKKRVKNGMQSIFGRKSNHSS
ncbi:hypothetical protein BSKO_05488 [Bryopsis sp. KO-2023]|nr:hypothetical protein BSKO_05488 [Bryopsis sp. KO-2023]